MKFYKIVNPAGHNGIVYREGINVDPKPFDKNSNVDGGIFFAKENIFAYLGYGTELYEVEPIGEVKKIYIGGYKAHKVNLKYIGKAIDNIQFLVEQGADINCYGSMVLTTAAINNRYTLIQYLFNEGVITYSNDALSAFLTAIKNNYIDIAEFFIDYNSYFQSNQLGIQYINRYERTEILEYIRNKDK